MREIDLGNGVITFVDDEDYEAVVSECKWALKKSKRERHGYAHNPNKWWFPLHLFIYRRMTGRQRPPVGFVIDHENRFSLDNRRANIRAVTWSVQNRNRTPSYGPVKNSIRLGFSREQFNGL